MDGVHNREKSIIGDIPFVILVKHVTTVGAVSGDHTDGFLVPVSWLHGHGDEGVSQSIEIRTFVVDINRLEKIAEIL
jgi:hypothetical protein